MEGHREDVKEDTFTVGRLPWETYQLTMPLHDDKVRERS